MSEGEVFPAAEVGAGFSSFGVESGSLAVGRSLEVGREGKVSGVARKECDGIEGVTVRVSRGEMQRLAWVQGLKAPLLNYRRVTQLRDCSISGAGEALWVEELAVSALCSYLGHAK